MVEVGEMTVFRGDPRRAQLALFRLGSCLLACLFASRQRVLTRRLRLLARGLLRA